MIAYIPTPLILRVVKNVPWSRSLIFIFYVFFIPVEKQTDVLRMPTLYMQSKNIFKKYVMFSEERGHISLKI